MPLPYIFTVHDNDSCTDSLGGMQLGDDGEAMAFGKQVIREIIHRDAKKLYAGWAIDITKGLRAVGSIPFNRPRH